MRKGSLLIGVSLMMLLPSAAPSAAAVAPPQLKWTRQFPGWVMAVDTTTAGSTAVVGSRSAPGDHYAMFVAVYGPLGGMRWLKTWRPLADSTTGLSVAVASDGSVYVGGERIHVVGYEAESWWFLRRYAADGSLLWHRDQSHAQHPLTWGAIHAIATRSGGVVVAGADTGCCDVSAGQEGWVRAFDSGGRALWTNRFEPPGIPSRTQDLVWDVAVHRGAIYAGGYVAIGAPEEPWKDHEAVVARLTASGKLVWARIFRDRGLQDDLDAVQAIGVAAGKPVAAIEVFGPHDGVWTRLVRLSSADGVVRWSRSTDGWPGALDGTSAGDVFLLTRHPVFMVRRFGPGGGLLWSSGDVGHELDDLSLAGRRMSVVGVNPTGSGSRIWRYAVG